VLHIDYDGTGDSSGGDGDPGRVEAWRRSIGAAVALMRAGGAPYVSLVGMRLGATLAASVSQDCKPEGLVLWDPCDSGRSYLREQAVLCLVYEPNEIGSAASGTGPATRDNGLGKVETLGNVYWPATVRAMSELTIGAIPDVLAGHVLALLRPGATKRSLLERLSELGAEVVDAVDQELMMDVSYSQLFAPQSTVGTIVRWLSQNAPTEMAPFTLATPGTATMSGPKTAGAADEVTVTEDIKHLGRNKLFAVLTEPTGPRPEVTVVLLNGGTTDHTGPGRLWVDLARSWASAGARVVRADLSGIGDSPARPGEPVDAVYSPHALQDVADIVAEVSPGNPSAVVLMGLCSGAYHSIRAGIDLGVGGVVAINPIFSQQLNEMPGLRPMPEPHGWRAATARATRQVRTFAYWKLIGANKRFTRGAARLLEKGQKDSASVPVAGHLAQPLGEMWWWCVNRISPSPRPAQFLERLAKQGVDTLVMCREDEAAELRRGDEGELRRLEKNPSFHMELVPQTDHSLFTQASRESALPVLTRHVLSRYETPLN
jgi:alpha-beta hydrolase superfamily lysophospholipase